MAEFREKRVPQYLWEVAVGGMRQCPLAKSANRLARPREHLGRPAFESVREKIQKE